MQIKKLLLVVLCVVFFACNGDDQNVVDDLNVEVETAEDSTEDSEEELKSVRPNVLLIIADDMGLDASPGYDIGNLKPNMPNLQSLISSGIIFDNVWSNPTCTPTRASILTGKYGLRTNVLKVGDELATSEMSIQAYIAENATESYSSALIGKWHLSQDINQPGAMGIDYFAGIMNGGVQDYFNWNLVENGTTTTSTVYTTTKLTDLAIDWVTNQTQPWFLWLAYNAPHVPFHLPPIDLHSQGSLPTDQASIEADPLPYYLAAIEAMDSEMGRLLDSMSQEERDNTLIIFIGDNGTPNQVRQEYVNRRVKGSVYQGGVNVPMVVSGATVNRSNHREEALIGTTDLFSTIAEIAGADVTQINDSKSFKSLFDVNQANNRTFAYTEIGQDGGGSEYSIRNETHKYIMFANGDEALFDLSIDPLEVNNLLNENQLPISETNNIEKSKLVNEASVIRN